MHDVFMLRQPWTARWQPDLIQTAFDNKRAVQSGLHAICKRCMVGRVQQHHRILCSTEYFQGALILRQEDILLVKA